MGDNSIGQSSIYAQLKMPQIRHLEVGDQVRGTATDGAVENGAASALEQQELIESLWGDEANHQGMIRCQKNDRSGQAKRPLTSKISMDG